MYNVTTEMQPSVTFQTSTEKYTKELSETAMSDPMNSSTGKDAEELSETATIVDDSDPMYEKIKSHSQKQNATIYRNPSATELIKAGLSNPSYAIIETATEKPDANAENTNATT